MGIGWCRPPVAVGAAARVVALVAAPAWDLQVVALVVAAEEEMVA